jgi:hypothetical protein
MQEIDHSRSFALHRSEKEDNGDIPRPTGTLCRNCLGWAALRREQWEQLERSHHEKPTHRKEGETDHGYYKHSPRKRKNGGMPVGYLGQKALRREQWSMYSCCYETIMRRNMCCLVMAGKNNNNIWAITRQLPIATLELLKAVFFVGSALGPYNEDPRPAQGNWERSVVGYSQDRKDLSVGSRRISTVNIC